MYKHLTFDDLLAFSFCNLLSLRWKVQQRLLFCKRLLALLSTTMMYETKKTGFCIVMFDVESMPMVISIGLWNMACFDICNIILSRQIICGNTFVLSKPFCLSVWFYELHLSISAISNLKRFTSHEPASPWPESILYWASKRRLLSSMAKLTMMMLRTARRLALCLPTPVFKKPWLWNW